MQAYLTNAGDPTFRLIENYFLRRAIKRFTVDQVKLLGGYPKQSGSSLLVAFFVNNPLASASNILPSEVLVHVVSKYKADIGAAIGKTIGSVEAVQKDTTETPPPATTIESTKAPPDETWKWILIGVFVGVFVIVIVIIVVIVM